MKRALVLYGGWPDHKPVEMARWAEDELLSEYTVCSYSTLDILESSSLGDFDVLLPIWTFGEIAPAQEKGLLTAVEGGLGVLAWHGFTSAFLASRTLKHLAGGQFVCHPGGEDVSYRVEFDPASTFTQGLSDFEVATEQYYFLLDPAIEAVATTRMLAPDMPWLAGVKMPVAWKRNWGAGRVFYCALGHRLDDMSSPSASELLRRGLHWATRP